MKIYYEKFFRTSGYDRNIFMSLREPQGKFHGRRTLCQFSDEAFFLVSDYALNFFRYDYFMH